MTKIDAALHAKEDVSNRVDSVSASSDADAYPSVGAMRDYVADAKAAFEAKPVVALNITGTVKRLRGYSEFSHIGKTEFESLVAYRKAWSVASSPSITLSGRVNLAYTEGISMEHSEGFAGVYIMKSDVVLLRITDDGTVEINGAGALGYSIGDTVTVCFTVTFPRLRAAFIDSEIASEAVSPKVTVQKVGTCTTLTVSDAFGERSVEISDGISATPQFVSSISDCTDTDGLYVLPDGYIYAYLPVTEPTYTNLLPSACDTDGTAYGTDGCGYKSGYRINSSGTAVQAPGTYLTGLIPFSVGSALRMKNLAFYDADSSTYTGIATYDSSKSFLGVINFKNLSYGYAITQGSTVKIDTSTCISTSYELSSSVAYIRIMSTSVTENSIVTVDEEITESSGAASSWQSTGHVYQSADYEPRVASLESRMAEAESKLAVDSPSYITDEAERVSDLVLGDITEDSFTISLAGDMHMPYGVGTPTAVLHTGLGIAEIARCVPLNLCAYLGDYVSGGSTSTVAESKSALRFVRRALTGRSPGTPEVWLRGNHDMNPYCRDGVLSASLLRAYIDSANRSCRTTSAGRKRGFGYIDFDDRRIRVIYLNTSDTSDITYAANSGNYNVSMIGSEQLQWLSDDALNLYGKSSPEKWGFIVLSHAPLNWQSGTLTDGSGTTYTANVKNALALLDAYVSGSTGQFTVEGKTVKYDFRGITRGEIIALFHGHTHNFRTSTVGLSQFRSISIPQVCAGRYNEYTAKSDFGEFDSSGNPVYYLKSTNTAEDTSFCVATVDRTARRISIRHYGAGYDRTVTY